MTKGSPGPPETPSCSPLPSRAPPDRTAGEGCLSSQGGSADADCTQSRSKRWPLSLGGMGVPVQLGGLHKKACTRARREGAGRGSCPAGLEGKCSEELF